MSAALTTLWARAFVDELARCGVRDVVVAPGSRSTPLVMAMAHHGGFRMRVHFDERSAGFFALGVGKVGRGPAAVVTTSGTATANLYPAVIEAAQSEVPLLLLTADRPPGARGLDANQTIDQVRLYGEYPRAFFDTGLPELSEGAFRTLRMLACRAVLAARGAPAGPVHVNFPFDKPLEPGTDDPAILAFLEAAPTAGSGRPDGVPFVAAAPSPRRLGSRDLAELAHEVRSASRVVLVAGPRPDPDRLGASVVRFAQAAGVPVLADPLSGARQADGCEAVAVAGYDLFLREPEMRAGLEADLILRVGAAPTSASLLTWLSEHRGTKQIVVDDGGRWKDHAALAYGYVPCDPAEVLDGLASLGPEKLGGGDVRARASSPWFDAGTAVRELFQAAADVGAGMEPDEGAAGASDEGAVPALVADALPDGATLFVSSSMPVRDLDARLLPRDHGVRIVGNRGASGIDGIVSSAFGAATAERPTVCVLGDLALFHDQNGLLFAREPDLPVVFVLIDNDGGGIFGMLPIAEHDPHFTTYFTTPHGLDFAHTAALHGVTLVDAAIGEVGRTVRLALEAGGTRIVRVRAHSGHAHRARRAFASMVAQAVREALADHFEQKPNGNPTS